jgi:DNA-binding SARP family transcriptional activator
MAKTAPPADRPRFNLLGPPLLEDARGPLRLNRRKSVSLLAYLALEPRVHARDSLCALFWPECEQAKARANLRSSLFELSHALGEGFFMVAQDRLRLRPEALWVDVADLEEACGASGVEGGGPSAPDSREGLEAAVRSWRGGFMAGFSLPGCADFDDWQFRWAGRARKAYCVALGRLATCELGAGRLIAAEELAARWIAAEPLNEEARRLQIRVLIAMNQPEGARRSYERWERTSCEELGREPGRETRELIERAPGIIKIGAGRALPPASARTELLGRACQLSELLSLLEEGAGRLLTLTGPGGVGKTAIARALLERARPRFPDGAWFIDLSTERDARRIPFRLAAALGMRDSASAPAAMTGLLAERLRASRSLVVLDNLEQIEGAAEALSPFLGSPSGPAWLATSRRALGGPGERIQVIGPLPFPGEDCPLDALEAGEWPALELLLLRSGLAAGPGLDADTLALCARICARLDGLPLALELAAPLLAFLGPQGFLERLERHLALDPDRSNSRPDRQRSLSAVVEWSRCLLSPAERLLFAGLAAFEGSFVA